MKKILLAMIALLFAVSAMPVAYAEGADEATAETMQEELPPLIDPAIAGDNS
jgi:hypothetical protein